MSDPIPRPSEPSHAKPGAGSGIGGVRAPMPPAPELQGANLPKAPMPNPDREMPPLDPLGPGSSARAESVVGPSRATAQRVDPPSVREDIPIPDLKLLRRIGSGAYGEVWLAQTITGALRAVKVVWREDFEYEKTFHREFEGIKQFEPISRGHKGLVNVLHVGWNEKSGFYYCVMELADDSVNGRAIEVSSYVPRTLTSDFKRLGRLDLGLCQQIGILLADALGYMHSYGLIHRDIKPSNIIFAGGEPKLADIGLVAAHGERTFVGTEGFVPPEGPGTFASDIYSLGKVLYEISSGKDRMEFPEVPDDLDADQWKLWREWNTVICKACAPNVKERFASAADFAEALRLIGVPKPVPLSRRVFRGAWTLVTGSLFLGTALGIGKLNYDWHYTVPAPVARQMTPQELAKAKLPTKGRMWLNSFDMKFTSRGERHVADKLVSLDLFSRFLDATLRSFEGEVVATGQKGAESDYVVIVPKQDADAFCDWLTEQDRMADCLDADFEYRWTPDNSVKRNPGARAAWSAFRLEVVRLQFGLVQINSTPPHAEVIKDGEALGNTPLTLKRVRLGEISLVVNQPGYKRELLKGKVESGKTLTLNAKLRPTDAVSFGRKWKNSLGMDFEPLGSVLISTLETRRADYGAYLRSIPTTDQPPVDTQVDMELPMTFVSRREAQAFCAWLTYIERAKGLLEEGQHYRLPTDEEWSMAANLLRERGNSPAERNQMVGGFFPWGFNWPPIPPAGNLWDLSAAEKAGRKDGIAGYADGFPLLAPGGSFPANELGLRDLGGNVWEWVEEDFGGNDPKKQQLGVVRGGSWRTFNREELLSSHRKSLAPTVRNDEVGFRIVLSGQGDVAREANP